MKLIKVGAAALNQTPLDWAENRAHILEAISRARALGIGILCLPELSICGYGCEDAFHSPGVQAQAWSVLQEILPETRGLVVSLGLPLMYCNALFNVAALVCDGQLLGFVAKQYLAGDGIHYEPRWFKPWPAGVRVSLEAAGRRYPLGDLHFNCGGIRIGFEICEDAWVAKRPGGALSLKGVDVFLNPSASHFAFGKAEVRKRFVLEGSRAFGTTYLYGNLLGCESGRAIYDGDAMIASSGRLLVAGSRFSFADVQLASAVVDVDITRMNQARTGSFRPDLESDPNECINAEFTYPSADLEETVLSEPAWSTGPFVKEEEFTRAVSLALFDYMRKSRSRGFVVSLSGGADSAAVSCLVVTMVELGVRELGLEDFKKKLAYIDGIREATETGALVRALLTCVYQSTAQSSEVTRGTARQLAAALQAEFFDLDVDTLVRGYVDLVSRAVGRPMTWETDDITLQNIQARARAPGVWMIANLRNAILLATSNRSEAAVGYATMDGDTCGGLSPIAGIDKAFLRQWLTWLETHGPDGRFKVPELKAVNGLRPTAELRPAQMAQTDEDDLMPYEVLDAVERAAIRDKRLPLEVYKLLCTRFECYSTEQLAVWVERFYRLWCRNQWKRERYAPSFHLDDENLDPKTWCRFPILSGGFEQELALLKAYVNQPE